ncbi:mdtL [Symbiodinium natans]|uniref:MdtL protein n=1 Tax=Symbiodinium natans TaxID=878477 RepID=A0A812QGI3_9DINO|nr:mdtL [Symbiodinium natans]
MEVGKLIQDQKWMIHNQGKFQEYVQDELAVVKDKLLLIGDLLSAAGDEEPLCQERLPSEANTKVLLWPCLGDFRLPLWRAYRVRLPRIQSNSGTEGEMTLAELRWDVVSVGGSRLLQLSALACGDEDAPSVFPSREWTHTASDLEALSSFLQVDLETKHLQDPVQARTPAAKQYLLTNAFRDLLATRAPADPSELIRTPEKVSPLLKRLEIVSDCLPSDLQIQGGLVGFVYALSAACGAGLLLCGLPSKEPQHPSMRRGGSTSLVVYLGLVYAFCYFATDQYVPSLPQMEVDLQGSQTTLSGTVQLNLVVKAVFGVLAAGLSDRIGRKPVLLVGTVLLAVASFCCGCAGRIEWFLAARVLQGMGESVEPVVFAMARDAFPQREERPSMEMSASFSLRR